MRDKVFIDTNVLVYFVSDDKLKKDAANNILQGNEIFISTQVINEFTSVTIKKNILSISDAFKYSRDFMDIFNMCLLYRETIEEAQYLMNKIKLSLWDSLIISSALECNCSILYSEDMQDNQLIKNQLRIINPFR